jgi:hypothetical protein
MTAENLLIPMVPWRSRRVVHLSSLACPLAKPDQRATCFTVGWHSPPIQCPHLVWVIDPLHDGTQLPACSHAEFSYFGCIPSSAT